LATPMMALAIVAIAAALTRAARSHRAPRIVFVAAAAGAGVIVGAIGALAGAHPVPGNCVL